MSNDDAIKQEFTALVQAALHLSADIGEEVEQILQDGQDRPLTREEAAHLLTEVVTVVKRAARKRGDAKTAASLDGDVNGFIAQVVEARERVVSQASAGMRRLELQSYNGIPVAAVRPKPTFHGIEVAMMCGFVKTADIALWDANERLEIHLGQFEKQHNRRPSAEEVLEIMLGRMRLPGVSVGDEFDILELARSIAANGVRKPPIIDLDGTLLDGNRRVAACNLILSSQEFTQVEKKRAETIFVWQLTEHATDTEREAVVVSLNFEDDCKKPWPVYVKARKVYDEWEAMLALEYRPTNARLAEMRRELSKKFALGMDTSTVSRYIKMVELVIDFEEYHVNQKQRDEFEVKHKASMYFEYFDELSKGVRPGGVAHALESDETFKGLVYDLLFEGKFRNWNQIRDLKHACTNQESREGLARARMQEDVDTAQDTLDNSLRIAKLDQVENRLVGANTRIESFTKWLNALPLGAFREEIRPENLRRLVDALQIAQAAAAKVLEEEGF